MDGFCSTWHESFSLCHVLRRRLQISQKLVQWEESYRHTNIGQHNTVPTCRHTRLAPVSCINCCSLQITHTSISQQMNSLQQLYMYNYYIKLFQYLLQIIINQINDYGCGIWCATSVWSVLHHLFSIAPFLVR